MSTIQQWGSFELEAAEEEYEELERGGGSQWFKFQVGRNVVRFLPPPADKRTPFTTVYQHFLYPPGAQQPAVFNCPRAMAKQKCPLCEKADKLRQTGNQADRDRAYELFPKRRVFANIIDRNDEESGPKIAGFGKTVYEQLLNLRKDEDAGGDFTHPDEGFDIVIERKGSGKNDTQYFVRPAKTRALGNYDWIGEQPDLEKLAQVPTMDEIRQKLLGDDEGGAPPSRRMGSGGGSRGGGGSRRSGPTAQDDLDFSTDDFED